MKNLSLYYFLYYLALSSFSPYLSLFLIEKGISATSAGMLLSLWALVSVIAQPVMGIMSDRRSSGRTVLIFCTAVSPVLGLGFYFFDGYFALIALSILFPWFQSSTGPLSDALAVEIGRKEKFSFGAVRLWGALSFSAGTFVTGFLYEKIGYGKSFFSYLIISVFVLITVFLFPKTDASPPKLTLFDQTRQVLWNKPFMIFVGICFLLTMSSSINFTFLPIYFKESGFEKSWIGIAYSVAAIIEVPMFWIAAKLNDRIGRFYILSISALLYAIKCLVLYWSHNVYAVLAIQLFDGISFAFFASVSVEMVEEFADKESKASFQTIFAAITYGLGGIVGSALGGIAVDHFGSPVLYFMLFVLCFAAAVFFLIYKSTEPEAKDKVHSSPAGDSFHESI